jgi:hypothetical protein
MHAVLRRRRRCFQSRPTAVVTCWRPAQQRDSSATQQTERARCGRADIRTQVDAVGRVLRVIGVNGASVPFFQVGICKQKKWYSSAKSNNF